MFHRRSALRELTNAADQPEEIGSNLYLWRNGRRSCARNLVITSHGTYFPRPEGSGTFRTPFNLYFYGPHNWALRDPGLGLLDRQAVPNEVISAGHNARNYRLTKFQARAGAGEKYQNVAYSARTTSQPVDPNLQYDILTIRNHWATASSWRNIVGITLRDVLNELEENNLRYNKVHCVFCRSNIFGDLGTWETNNFQGVSS